jgi:hypothetical protein
MDREAPKRRALATATEKYVLDGVCMVIEG